jgi:hypothetical protein
MRKFISVIYQVVQKIRRFTSVSGCNYGWMSAVSRNSSHFFLLYLVGGGIATIDDISGFDLERVNGGIDVGLCLAADSNRL